MKMYKNLNHDSGIRAYETGTEFILVQFSDGEIYQYSYLKPGIMHVEAMKKLAARGKGLATYINQFVRGKFERKL